MYGAMAAAVIVRRRQQQPACSGRWAAGRRRRRRALQRLPATAAAALLAVVLGASPTSAEQLERVLDDVAGSAAIGRLGRAPLADGCARVYVDVGTNVGVQIRKLFEADKYRGAMVLGYFNVLFGNGTSRATDGALCAFGFEPNPLMTPRLRQLEESYAAQGWRVRIFTETAAGASDGVVNISYGESMADSLATMAGAPAGARPALGGAVRLERRRAVRRLDLARWLREEVVFRRIPARGGRARHRPAVLMKLDVEGAEIELLPALLRSGVLCHVNLTMAEWHGRMFGGPGTALRRRYDGVVRGAERQMRAAYSRTSCRAVLIQFDDETFAFDDGTRKANFGPTSESRAHGFNASLMTPLPPNKERATALAPAGGAARGAQDQWGSTRAPPRVGAGRAGA